LIDEIDDAIYLVDPVAEGAGNVEAANFAAFLRCAGAECGLCTGITLGFGRRVAA
jgi:hypothetical protein